MSFRDMLSQFRTTRDARGQELAMSLRAAELQSTQQEAAELQSTQQEAAELQSTQQEAAEQEAVEPPKKRRGRPVKPR